MQSRDIKQQFLTCLRAIYQSPGMSMAECRQRMDARERSLERLHTMVEPLWGCWDQMPAWACRNLRLGKHATYHDAAIRLSLNLLDELNDTDFLDALVVLFQQDFCERHPEAPEVPILPPTPEFITWLRAYFPGEAEELIRQFRATPRATHRAKGSQAETCNQRHSG